MPKPPMTIEELVEQFDVFSTWMPSLNTRYTAIENFPKHGVRTYELINLVGEFITIADDNIVVFSDKYDVLRADTTKVLNMFLISSIVGMERDYVDSEGNLNDYYVAKIIFESGDITIKVPINTVHKED